MSNNNQTNLASADLWIRLVYMVLFGALSWLARVVILIIAAIQFLLVLLAGNGNGNLRQLGDGIARWTQQAYAFLTFASDDKPYPFQDWPAPAEEENTESGPDNSVSPGHPESTDDSPPRES